MISSVLDRMTFLSQHIWASTSLLAADLLIFFYRRRQQWNSDTVVFAVVLTVLLWTLTTNSSMECLAILLLRRFANLFAERCSSILFGFLRGRSRQGDHDDHHTTKSVSFLKPPRDWNDLYVILLDGGPLGKYCSKVITLGSSALMLFLLENSSSALSVSKRGPSWREFCQMGQLWPSWWMPCLVILFSLIVNLVLWLWSSWQRKSRGAHSGVHRMVDGTLDRKLVLTEHIMLVVWAFTNALCEEMMSRGIHRWEYFLIWKESSHPRPSSALDDDSDLLGWESSNFWQAASFGLAHYYGVPSGWTGVGLTFIYGWLMGTLQGIGGGLLYPILTHTVADYWIFSQIARRR